MRARDTGRLLEREAHLGRLGALVERVMARDGGCLTVVTGAAGLGKTSLLAAVSRRASAGGMRTLSARGGELEGEFAFGVVRQLFEPAVASLSDPELGTVFGGAASLTARMLGRTSVRERRISSLFPLTAGSVFPLLHAFYWLTANLAALGPFVAIVDDIHWADEQSLRWLLYLARRVEELPMLVVVAFRVGEPGGSDLLDQFLADPRALRLAVEPLGEQSVGELVAEAFGHEGDAEFTHACYLASGGNPFFLGEVLSELRATGAEPIAAAASAVPAVRPESVIRTLLLRFGRLSVAARALARAVAVLGEPAPLRRAAVQAGLEYRKALDAAAELVRAEILESDAPLSFVHPLVRAAVYADITPALRSDEHARAARLLAAEDAPPERVASQIMKVPLIGDPDAGAILWAAAADARDRGAPETAVRYLERALDEPSPIELRPALLSELGVAEARSGKDAAVVHLREALDLTSEPALRAARALDLANTLLAAERATEAYDLLESAIGALSEDDRELRLTLEAELLSVAQIELALSVRGRGRIERLGQPAGETPGERLVLAALARERQLGGAPRREIVELARRALADGRLLEEQRPESPPFYDAVAALGGGPEAEQYLARAFEQARVRGSLLGHAIASSTRALILRVGSDVRELEAEAANAVRTSREVGWKVGFPVAVAAYLTALIEQGRLAEADELLAAEGMAGELPERLYSGFVLYERGRLRAAQARPADALADLLELGRREAEVGYALHAVAWRAAAAPQADAAGDPRRARTLAEEALELARGRGRRLSGIALRSLALVDPERRIALLEQSVSVLSASHGRLDHARALTDLGAALRRAGRRADAREPLRNGLQLAHDCGAFALEQRARTELAAAGARPRSVQRSGLETLTASERRVAELAAGGLTNPEIAQTLFVTVKTVETHLHRTYQKLDISKRSQLARAMDRGS